jgi:hypothetical protein
MTLKPDFQQMSRKQLSAIADLVGWANADNFGIYCQILEFCPPYHLVKWR